MGKIVKYCNSCDEGFAAKFAFCPDCGETLEAFEMSPVDHATTPTSEVIAPPVMSDARDLLEIPDETTKAAEPQLIEPVEDPIVEVAPLPAESETTVEPVVEAATAEPVAAPERDGNAVNAAATSANWFHQTNPVDADRKAVSLEAEHDAYASEGKFYVTVVEEKNVKQRNTLLLGSLCLVLFSLMTGLVYNIFSKDLEVGAIGDEMFLASLIDDVPMAVEEEEQKNKDKEAGGGGGGGREEEELTKGDLANQTKNPERPPQAIPRMENPTLTLPPASTQGNKTFEQKYDRYGDPNGRFASWNNGSGTGNGQGTGTGTGQGSGRGTGAGSGDGSGFGSGIGNGNGDGRGDGDASRPPPPRPVGVSQDLKIISKPRATYTAGARENNFTGSVLLRITFTASGQIGSISAVKGAPYGLTESAIAAARRIVFEPKKINGVPVAVSKTFEYSFTLY